MAISSVMLDVSTWEDEEIDTKYIRVSCHEYATSLTLEIVPMDDEEHNDQAEFVSKLIRDLPKIMAEILRRAE